MGNLLSFDDEMDGEVNGAVAREQLQQRQRAQVLLLSQLRQESGGPAALGLRPMQQPSLRQTQVFKNPLHVRAKSVQLSCTQSNEEEESEQWQLSFIFDALVPCEVLVHVGRCGVEVRQSLHPGDNNADVVVSETGCGEYRWVSSPAQFREGLNQEFRGSIELGDFATAEVPEPTLDPIAEGMRPRIRSQGFCIELKAVKARRSLRVDNSPSRPRSRSQSIGSLEGPQRRPSQEETSLSGREDGSLGLAAEWTTGRFVRRDCHQVSMEISENPGEVVEAKIFSQSVKLPENSMAPCYSMFEVYGADPSEGGIGAECAICMSERRDTAVLPCRHMCLCSGCAETMRTQIQYHSYRCPICRERVSSLLQKRPES